VDPLSLVSMSELPLIQNRVAVIDCGTNTFNLLVADPQETGWTTVYQTKLPVKIGEGSFEDKTIKAARFARGLDALLAYKYVCKNYECSRVFAYGTSALRESINGKEFAAMGAKILGVPVHIIDGMEEAELIYRGVQLTYPIQDETALIMDIGGGSTEFVMANSTGVLWMHSFNIGVSRLYDTIQPSDPLQHRELMALKSHLHETLRPLKEAIAVHRPQRLIGSSGTFDTLLDLYFASIKSKKPMEQSIQRIPLATMHAINDRMITSTFEQRLTNPAIPEMRVQFMPMACALLDDVLRMHDFQEIIHSPYSLKEGALSRLLQTEATA
jgi:exopolyphosphatase/guanosine-5'-triphosphate,3'-diphosphate pyrophosphatase